MQRPEPLLLGLGHRTTKLAAGPLDRGVPFGARVHGVGAPRSTTRRTRAGPEGESDEMVQIAQIEWLVQITGGPRDQRLGLLPGCPGRRSS